MQSSHDVRRCHSYRPSVHSAVRGGAAYARRNGAHLRWELHIVNAEGWILTSAHNAEIHQLLAAGRQQSEQLDARRLAILTHDSLTPRLRDQELTHLGEGSPTWPRQFAYLWGDVVGDLVDATIDRETDLLVARLPSFDPQSVATYPKFRDPAAGVPPGTSLCTIGFALNDQVPVTYDDARGEFQFPGLDAFVPLPLDGILTRCLRAGQREHAFIETSHPGGVQGQSGGPVIDREGTVWGVQSHVRPFPLDVHFQEGSRRHTAEHQYLRLGRGTHPTAIIDILQAAGISYDTRPAPLSQEPIS